MHNWLVLVIGLPTANATTHIRAWPTLKASGATVLRDGAYLLPALPACEDTLVSVRDDILAINGTAYLLVAAIAIFDGLLLTFAKEETSNGQ